MEEDIYSKLSERLNQAPNSEENFVYMLSRIRKLLEIEDHPSKYSILNFYCNLALHSRIEKPPRVVVEGIKRVMDAGLNPEMYSNTIINYQDFHNQLKEFLIEKSLPNFYDREETRIADLNKILTAIYSDTPITLECASYEVEIDKNGMIHFNARR